jgi:hypothetical protein
MPVGSNEGLGYKQVRMAASLLDAGLIVEATIGAMSCDVIGYDPGRTVLSTAVVSPGLLVSPFFATLPGLS